MLEQYFQSSRLFVSWKFQGETSFSGDGRLVFEDGEVFVGQFSEGNVVNTVVESSMG